ncbi:MAG: tol-pal system protein YbgF [Thermodesulfobacteriota bacterium]
MTIRNGWLLVSVMALATALSGCATTSDMSGLDSRLSYLERRYSDSERNRDQYQQRMEEFRKGQSDQMQQVRTQTAELYAAIDRMREDIQKLNGRLEIKERNLNEQPAGGALSDRMIEIEKDLLAVKERISRLEEYLNLSNAKKAVPPPEPQPQAKTKPEPTPEHPLSETEHYAKAKQMFDSGDLEGARVEFQQFLKRFPKSSSADSAQFWIAEVYYRQKWYEKAILEYQKVIEGYPKGNKIQAALLKQGFSFFNLGDKANGKLVLKELIKKFPNSNEAKIAKQKLEGA